MSDRYEGKPFLKLLDNYVLHAIGALDAEANTALTEMEPKFRETFGFAGNWRQIVEAQMQFPAGMAGAIREIWQKGRVRFVEANGFEPNPHEFTRTFVDSKFPH